MTIKENNAYWMEQDEKLRKQGINPRSIDPKSIMVWSNGKCGYFVSYYDSVAKHQKLMTTSKFWGESLNKEAKDYNPDSCIEAYKYHSIINIINAYCEDATPKKQTPKQESEPERKPQLCARLKPMSEEDWIISYEPITTTSRIVTTEYKGNEITTVVYDTSPSGPIYKKRSKPVTNEDWIYEEYVRNADGTESIIKSFNIPSSLVSDYCQGFQRRRNKGKKKNRKAKKSDAPQEPTIMTASIGAFMGTKVVSKKEETVIEPGYGTPMIKTTYEYERYIKFANEESLNAFVADHNIIIGEPQLEEYISRLVLSRDVYGEDNKRYQHLMVPTQQSSIAPRVWLKTDNNTLVYEHSIEIAYRNEYWSTTLSDRQRVIELPPLDFMPIDISEEED